MRNLFGTRSGLQALAVAGLAIGSWGCSIDAVERDESQVILRPTSVVFSSGGGQGEGGAFLVSDVSPNFNDNVVVTLQAVPKNQNAPTDSFLQDVVLDRYEVRYIRSDGQNREGVDVPFRFTGAVAGLVPINGEGAATMIVVRHQAKQEPPLRNLGFANNTGVSGQSILTVVVEITIYGRTTAGDVVSALVRGTISFANFVDAE